MMFNSVINIIIVIGSWVKCIWWSRHWNSSWSNPQFCFNTNNVQWWIQINYSWWSGCNDKWCPKCFTEKFVVFIIDQRTSLMILSFAVIEKYTDNVRFCIICNYLSKIIPAVQSRCTRFRFAPLVEEQILPRLNHVIDEEKYCSMVFLNCRRIYKKKIAFQTCSIGGWKESIDCTGWRRHAESFKCSTEYMDGIWKCNGRKCLYLCRTSTKERYAEYRRMVVESGKLPRDVWE